MEQAQPSMNTLNISPPNCPIRAGLRGDAAGRQQFGQGRDDHEDVERVVEPVEHPAQPGGGEDAVGPGRNSRALPSIFLMR